MKQSLNMRSTERVLRESPWGAKLAATAAEVDKAADEAGYGADAAPLRRGSNEEMTMPTHCHNCRSPLSLAELASIEADPRVAEVVRYFGQAACNACCGKAAALRKRNERLRHD